MELLTVDDFDALDELLENHTQSNTLTNNYILSNEFRKHIADKKLLYWQGDNNLYLFLEKQGFYRLYYLVNDVSSAPDFSGLKLVLEIIYRGVSNLPTSHIAYWEKNGFHSHLQRDCYFLKSSKVSTKPAVSEDLTISSVKDPKDLIFAQKLIDQYLDFYTGDRLTLQELENYAELGLLYCAFKDGAPCGILHAEFKNNVFWLGHLVVDEAYRGLGIANRLVDYYLNEGLGKHAKQYQLWVISDNYAAVKLYKNKGFEYLNKSTYSMLKID